MYSETERSPSPNARCHSSKKPDNLPEDAEARKKAWRELVLRDDFLTDNFLSDDERYPCSELGTHIGAP